MLRTQRCGPIVLGCFLASTIAARAQQGPSLTAQVVGTHIRVSFDLNRPQDDDLSDRLAAPEPVSVIFIVKAWLKVKHWKDHPAGQSIVRVNVAPTGDRDTFAVRYTVNGAPYGSESGLTAAQAMDRLTSFTHLPLFGPGDLDAIGQYRLSIRAVIAGGTSRSFETPVLAAADVAP